MGALKKARWEALAQGLALGKSQRQAAEDAGYSGKNAVSIGCKLAKRPEIKERVKELIPIAALKKEHAIIMSKTWVLAGIREIIESAKAAGQWDTARKGYVDIGKELGMFVQQTSTKFEWDGDISQLNESQLERFQYVLERMAFGDDQARINAARRKALTAAGVTVMEEGTQAVDATVVKVEEDPVNAAKEPAIPAKPEPADEGW